jgi:hypothetical protein
MKLKTPIVLTITESENAALLWHVCNHAESVVAGTYRCNNITHEKLANLACRAHRTFNIGVLFSLINRCLGDENIDPNTGEKEIKPIEINLNEEYTAKVTSSGVEVGCQTFSHKTILEVAAAIKKMNPLAE